MVLRRRASRAELRYYHIFKDSISIIIIIIIIIKVNYNYQKKFKESFEVIFIRRRLSDHNKIKFAIKYLPMSHLTSLVSFDYFRIKFFL